MRQVSKQRALQLAHNWHQVGVPLPLVGAVRNPELAPCAACGAECRFLFHVNGGDGDAETKLVDSTRAAR
ncbi:hypothetical protein OAO87_00840 [bacterium]|nr:hypothetical protein [bacterium]